MERRTKQLARLLAQNVLGEDELADLKTIDHTRVSEASTPEPIELTPREPVDISYVAARLALEARGGEDEPMPTRSDQL